MNLNATLEMFRQYLPEGAEIEIVETDCRLIAKYLYKVTYTSKRTKRKFTITSKGDCLPSTHNDIRSHLARLVLTPGEQAKEFSLMAWREKGARQDNFFFNTGKVKGGGTMKSIRILESENRLDLFPLGG